jgi:adenosylmethionine---8-amino-7-oxononanoate aminotransferase
MSNWLSKDKQYVWHPFTQMKTAPEPLVVVKAKDAVLTAEDGKEYLDVNSSWWVNVHGHGRTELKQALSDQFDQVDHVIFAGATHPKAIELSERLCKLLPGDFSKVFFSDDGSTAVEVALKMAFQFWHNQGKPRKRIVALEGAYHGDTFGAMSVGQRGYFNEPFEPFFFNVDFLPFPDGTNDAAVLAQAQVLANSGEIAGLIVEPLVQGSAGMRMYSPDTLDELVRIFRKSGALIIYDEIMTGWGRTGKMFAMEHGTELPDIVCVSKGLTGGVLPLGLTITKDTIYQAFLSEDKLKALLHGHSYTGNPLACAVACASMDIFETSESQANRLRVAAKMNEFAQRLEDFPDWTQVRVLGTILAAERKVDEESSYFASVRDQIYRHFLDHGVLCRPLGNVVFFNPPYCITDDQLEHCFAVWIKFSNETR